MGDESDKRSLSAFDWLDEFFALPIDQVAPDEAFDWIFMMKERDWLRLETAWEQRSGDWQESCAYILGQGPVPESIPLLQRALFSENPEVAVGAACSFSYQRLEHGKDVSIDERIIKRLRFLLKTTGGINIEEVVRLLEQVDDEQTNT